jgi:DNA primase
VDNYSVIRALSFPAVAIALGLDVSKFQRKGKDYVGACPIHGSKNNVGCFRYEVDGGRWHCFSCNAKGRGGIDLAIKVRSIGFKQAVELLISFVEANPQPIQKEPPKVTVNVVAELVPFKGQYHKYQVPCPWLEERIPDQAIREKYGVFCYNNPAKKSAYSGRVMIPIKDVDGILYGYLGRLVEPDKASRGSSTTELPPKYLFPAGFPKQKFLFGAYELHQSLSALGTGRSVYQRVYLVESPFAVMRFASMGFPAVSPFGWSVSDAQCELLGSLSKSVVYLPDRNKRQECDQTIRLLAQTCLCRFPKIPEGIDDPEYLSREQISAL